jgi:hypothetical protein
LSKNPAFQFYPGDWLRDGIAGCSLAAQGLWLRLMLIMHDSPRYGYLCLPNGDPIPPASAARLCGCSEVDYDALTAELIRAGVPSTTSSGIIFSRRMVRDEKQRKEWRKRQEIHRLTKRDVTQMSPQCHSDLQSSSSSSSSNLNTRSKPIAQKPGERELPGFALFWEAYPRRIGKPRAIRAWLSKVRDDALWPEVLAGLEKWKLCEQWQEPRFIPHPATFLNDERWKDEVRRNAGTKNDQRIVRTLEAAKRVMGIGCAVGEPPRPALSSGNIGAGDTDLLRIPRK